MESSGKRVAVLTCKGDMDDPCFPARLHFLVCKLHQLIYEDERGGQDFEVTKVEPWNSVRVTFNMPEDAARRLRSLAAKGDDTLRQLGILSVQVEGGQVCMVMSLFYF